MRIEEDIKLDYADVLFRPKRSTLSSRKDVELKRTYKFKYSKKLVRRYFICNSRYFLLWLYGCKQSLENKNNGAFLI